MVAHRTPKKRHGIFENKHNIFKVFMHVAENLIIENKKVQTSMKLSTERRVRFNKNVNTSFKK